MDGYDQGDWGAGLRALGSAVAIARGVQNLWDAPLEGENKELRNLVLRRELEGPGPGEKFEFEIGKEAWNRRLEQEKFAFERGKEAQRRRDEQVKFVMSTFNELAKTASPADRKVLGEHASRFMSALTPLEQEAVGMMYSQSQLNPLNKKGEWFDESFGGAPKVTVDPSADPYGYALQMFNLEDYNAQKQGFVTGQVPPSRRILGLAEGVYGFRDDDKKVSVMRTEDFALQQVAKQFDVTPGEILLNNGFVFGKPRQVMVGGVLSNVVNKFDALKNRPAGMDVTPVQGALADLQKTQQDLQGFLAAWATKDVSGKTEGSRAYKSIDEMRTKGASNEAVLDWAKTVYPGYNFRIMDEGKKTLRGGLPFIGGWFDAYAEGEKERLIAWPGKRTGVQTADGKVVPVYYDSRTGRVFDPGGKVVADSLEEFSTYIAGKTMAEIEAEARGR